MAITRQQTSIVEPCITPFDERGDIEEGVLQAYLDFLAEKTGGVSVGAIYGSGLLVPLNQRKRLLEIASEVISGRTRFSAYVGAADPDTAVVLARHVEKVGADLLTCVQPFYYRHVDGARYLYYGTLVKAAAIPVYVYDSPFFAGNL